MTYTYELAEFIEGFKLSSGSSSAAEAAKHCILDTVGVAAGAADSAVMADIYKKSRMRGGEGECCVWGFGERLSAGTAAFYNAMLAHYLELDDVHALSKTHIGTVVIPAAWAMAEYLGKSGNELIEAVICGYEVSARLGMAIGVKSHRELGWHATGTMGVFGAAAACGKLLGLDASGLCSALGLAGTQAAGLWAFLAEGANTKILHAGNAARGGLTAAVMALAGIQGPAHILDAADGGLFRAMSRDYDLSAVTAGLGGSFEILRVENKPYPCCRSTHSAIDGALALRGGGLRPGDIDRVEVGTYLVGYRQCAGTPGAARPESPTEAKFSTAYTVACALLYGDIREKYFHAPYLGSRELMELCARVSVYPDARFTAVYPQHWGAELTVLLRDGSERSRYVQDPTGSVEKPLGEKELRAKVMPFLRARYGKRADELLLRIMELEKEKRLPEL